MKLIILSTVINFKMRKETNNHVRVVHMPGGVFGYHGYWDDTSTGCKYSVLPEPTGVKAVPFTSPNKALWNKVTDATRLSARTLQENNVTILSNFFTNTHIPTFKGLVSNILLVAPVPCRLTLILM